MCLPLLLVGLRLLRGEQRYLLAKVRESLQICKGYIRFFAKFLQIGFLRASVFGYMSCGVCFLGVVEGVSDAPQKVRSSWQDSPSVCGVLSGHKNRSPRHRSVDVGDSDWSMSGTSILGVFLRVFFGGHLRGCFSPSFRSVHSIRPHFISSPCLSYCLRLPTGGAVRVIFTTAVRSKLRLMASSNASIC